MISQKVHLPVVCNIPGTSIEWVADTDKTRLEQVSCVYGTRPIHLGKDVSILPDADICLLATPVNVRSTYLQQLGGCGIAVLCEKPFALETGEHQGYLAIPGSENFYCGYMRRTYRSFNFIRDAIENNWFGRVEKIEYSEGGRMTSGYAGSSTLGRSFREGGGVLRDLGCHGIDIILYLTGSDHFDLQQSAIAWDCETDRQVRARFSLYTGDNHSIQIEYSLSWLNPVSNNVIFYFENATLRCGIGPESAVEIQDGKGDWLAIEPQKQWATTFYQAFYLEWRDVLDDVMGNGKSIMRAKDGLMTTKLIDAIYEHGKCA